MPFRLKMMDSYINIFLSLDNDFLFQGDVIEILWSIIHSKWIESMTMARMEPRNMMYEELVEHLEKLELPLLDDIKNKSKPSFEVGKVKITKKDKFSRKKTRIGLKTLERVSNKKQEQMAYEIKISRVQNIQPGRLKVPTSARQKITVRKGW